MNLLLAEDDQRLGKLTMHLLTKKYGHTVDWVMDGDDAYTYASIGSYDLVILDWMIPKLDGVTVCRNLRKDGYGGAILMLTAKDSIGDRVEGLDSGADDYLVKPFEFEELSARIRALARRNFAPLQDDIIKIDDLVVNRTERTVCRDQLEIILTPREFQLLDLLIKNKGQVLSRELVLDRIWGYDSDISSNPVDVYIKFLRKKIDIPGKKPFILTVRGVGYKFDS